MLENKDTIKLKLKHVSLKGYVHFSNQSISHHLTICFYNINYFAFIAAVLCIGWIFCSSVLSAVQTLYCLGYGNVIQSNATELFCASMQ